MTYADDSALRESMYRAFSTRASDQGPHAGQWDNSSLIVEMLTLRQELAQLLGFESYAQYSLETKMAPNVDASLDFLRSLAEKALPHARRDMRELNEFAASQGAAAPLKVWDLAYWSEKLREDRFSVSDEELRPFLSLDSCLKGMLDVTTRLFGVTFSARPEIAVWHPDVRYYDVVSAQGETIAGFYMDVYARKGKRGGAWMGNCRDRYQWPSHDQLPVAYLNCNFPAPAENQPSLLNHRDLTTLFHEFGHSLHHMLTRIPYPAVGGIAGVEWDAVEQPSQFLENWCWQREALDGFARHVETGASMPGPLLERLLAARKFQAGMFLARQLEFAITDLRMHHEFDASDHGQIAQIVSEVRAEVAVVPYPRGNRFLNSFGHLFAGGYAAGYYSYLWAEQLAADAFSKFQEEGIFNAETGQQFRTEILETGGSRPAMESFVAFRGRAPAIEPLLASYGL
nr:oligopeptidase A-like [Nerophis lumbriciformis]